MTDAKDAHPLAELGTLLRELRKRAGLTQAELAKRAGAARDTVVRAERGESIEGAILSRLGQVLCHRLTFRRHWPRAAEMRRRFAHLHEERDE